MTFNSFMTGGAMEVLMRRDMDSGNSIVDVRICDAVDGGEAGPEFVAAVPS